MRQSISNIHISMSDLKEMRANSAPAVPIPKTTNRLRVWDEEACGGNHVQIVRPSQKHFADISHEMSIHIFSEKKKIQYINR